MDSNQGSIQNRVTIGSFGDDRITGSNETDIMIGLLGADTIRGDGGDDKIQGNEDLDKLYGEEGNDLLQGGEQRISCMEEMEMIYFQAVWEMTFLWVSKEMTNYMGTEDDIMQGGQGADYFDCGEAIDIIIDFNIEEGDDNAGNCEEISKNK